jgi:hypothetical protein
VEQQSVRAHPRSHSPPDKYFAHCPSHPQPPSPTNKELYFSRHD